MSNVLREELVRQLIEMAFELDENSEVEMEALAEAMHLLHVFKFLVTT